MKEGIKPGFTHPLDPGQDLLAMEHMWVCPDVIPAREVWLQQAQLLVEQVCMVLGVALGVVLGNNRSYASKIF